MSDPDHQTSDGHGRIASVVTSAQQPRTPTQGMSVAGRLVLLARVWRTAGMIQLALRRHSLPEVVATLDTSGAAARVSPSLLSRAVWRGLRIGPWRPRCLLRSLTLYALLRSQGDPAELVIGLPDRPTTIDAHAWVELDGRDIGPPPGRGGYAELTRYPRVVETRSA